MSRPKIEVYLEDERDKKRYKIYAKRMGFENLSSFIRFCVYFTITNIDFKEYFKQIQSDIKLYKSLLESERRKINILVSLKELKTKHPEIPDKVIYDIALMSMIDKEVVDILIFNKNNK